ncbi:LCP family protein [Streptomyces sp. NPDC048172]|uniref:LCP family protein n=1 Tax=Streptomyces sp. NPDC048172 TaxID=3365505 RepID=UPI00371038F8
MPGSHKRGRRRRRSRARTVAVVGLSFLILLTAGVSWLYLQLNGNIETFGSDGLSRDRPEGGAGGQNVLVIGSDARTGGNRKLGGGAKDDVGRSDTAFLLHVYGDARHAVAVSFPRDTLVDIPSCKLPDGSWTKPQPRTMFNAAFSVGQTGKGNPACTQNTVEKLTGLRVDHTVVVDFKGFAAMTSAVGGVPVCVPKDLYQGDLNPNRGSPGERLFRKGEQTVEGQRALDYVRLRHGLGDGSDIGRIKRQQAFVGSLIKKVKDQGLSPTTLLPLANAATRSMTVDEGLGTPTKMVDFTMSLKNVDLGNTRFVTLPWRYEGNRVAIVRSEADALWADLRADRTPASPSSGPRSGKGISVAVLNGTPAPGLAATAAGELRDHGFTVTSTGNADASGTTTTRIAYGPGERRHAKALAAHFPGSSVESTDRPGLTVTLGGDYEPGAASASPAPREQAKGRSAADDLCADLSYG